MLHIVSMDIVIDAQYGDARNDKTRNYWLAAIRDRKVVAFIAGPPAKRGQQPGSTSYKMAVVGRDQ